MNNTTSQTDGEVETVSSSSPGGELFEEPDELRELDEVDLEDEDEGGSGVVSGGLGVASVALGLLSLGGTTMATAYESRDELIISAKTTISTAAQQYPVYASMWHTQALFGMIFALAALLLGAGVLGAQSLVLSGRPPAWARGIAFGGVVIGGLGLIIGALTWFNVLVPQVT